MPTWNYFIYLIRLWEEKGFGPVCTFHVVPLSFRRKRSFQSQTGDPSTLDKQQCRIFKTSVYLALQDRTCHALMRTIGRWEEQNAASSSWHLGSTIPVYRTHTSNGMGHHNDSLYTLLSIFQLKVRFSSIIAKKTSPRTCKGVARDSVRTDLIAVALPVSQTQRSEWQATNVEAECEFCGITSTTTQTRSY